MFNSNKYLKILNNNIKQTGGKKWNRYIYIGYNDISNKYYSIGTSDPNITLSSFNDLSKYKYKIFVINEVENMDCQVVQTVNFFLVFTIENNKIKICNPYKHFKKIINILNKNNPHNIHYLFTPNKLIELLNQLIDFLKKQKNDGVLGIDFSELIKLRKKIIILLIILNKYNIKNLP